ILSTPIAAILNGCYSPVLNPTGNPLNANCLLVHRDVLGSVATANAGFVTALEANLGADEVQGFDVELNYDADLNDWGFEKAGSLSFNFIGTLVTENNTTLADGTILHCAGVWGSNCGEPQNRWKSSLRTTWTDSSGDFSVSLRWRHLSGVQFEGNLPGG